MTTPLPVHATAPEWAVAVAELPRSARLADAVAGAIVVVAGGEGWAVRVADAVAAGAVGCVVAGGLPDEECGDPGVPVVLERPLLRADDATAAHPSGEPRLIIVECGADRAEFPAVVRDAVGWARSFTASRGALALQAARARGRTASALLADPAGSIAVTVVASTREGRAPWLRASAIAPERVEVVVDAATFTTKIERTSAAGRLVLPRHDESSARLALRRAIRAVSGADAVSDLADLAADAQLARGILAAP